MLVHKADGAVWICVDVCKVTTILKFDVYAMPHIHELWDRLGTAHF